MLSRSLESAGPSVAHCGVEVAGVVSWRPENIRSRDRGDRRVVGIWLAGLGIAAVGILVVHVWLRLQVVEVGYQLQSTRQLVERFEEEGRELQVRAAEADTPARLESLARRRLGMQPPELGREIVLP